MMDGNGVVSFELKAQAQAFPASDVEWEPTEHVVRFPSRRAKVWLASDRKFLLNTLDTALDTLSASIVSVYLPEGKRISSSQERSPLVDVSRSNTSELSSGHEGGS
jgi:hypothetical protein